MNDIKTGQVLAYEKIEQMFLQVSKLRIGVIGDGCLDVYWKANMNLSELSRETPHYPLPVVEERTSLGAAGNVAANLRDLGVGQKFICVQPLEMIGGGVNY